MAGCIIAAGVTRANCDSRFSSPGIDQDNVYIFNRSEISAFTSSVTGEVSAITFAPSYEVGFKIDIHKGSGTYNEKLVVSTEAAPYYEQMFTARVISNDTTTRNSIEGFVGVILAFKQKNGKFRIIGESSGIKLEENEFDTGAVAGDSVGDTLVWKGEENGKANFFLDTDEATTKITLDSYL